MTSKSMPFRFPEALAQAIAARARAMGRDQTTVVLEALNQAFGLPVSSPTPVTIEALNQPQQVSIPLPPVKNRLQLPTGLEQRETTLEQILEAIPEPIFVCDRLGRLTYINLAGVHVLGFERSQVIGKTGLELGLTLDSVERHVHECETLFKTGQPTSGEVTISTSQEDTRAYEYLLSPVQSINGSIDAIVCTARDITQRQIAEIALRESEANYRNLFESANDSIFIIDASTHRVLNANWNASRRLGYTRCELLELSIEDIDAPMAASSRAAMLRELQATGHVIVEHIHRRKDGTEMPVEISSRIIEYHGRLAIQSFVRDITERKIAEAALPSSEAKFRQIYEYAPVMMHSIDESGSICDVNHKWLEETGYTRAEVIGHKLDFLMTPESSKQAIETVVPQFWRDGYVRDVPYQYIRKDGTVIDILLNCDAVRDPEGKRISLSVSRNITELKRAESALKQANEELEIRVEERTAELRHVVKQLQNEIQARQRAEVALQESEARLNGILNSLDNVVWSISAVTREVLYLNPAAEQVYDRPLPAFFDNPHLFLEVVHPEDQEQVSSYMNSIMDTGSSEMEYRIVRSNGEVHWVLNRGRLAYNSSGTAMRVDGILTDITERKIAEEALRQSEGQLRQQATQLEVALHELQHTQAQLVQTEKMSSLGQLVAGVAHEINNPVTFIYGNLKYADEYTQQLLQLLHLYAKHYPNPVAEIQDQMQTIDLDFLMSDLPKLLNSMEVGAERIRQIVLTLRNFSRLDEAQMKPCDIHFGLDNTLLLLQNRLKANAGQPGVEIIKEYGDLPQVECYAGQLNQVFMNLLTNAIDALDDYNSKRSVEEIKAQPPTIRIRTCCLESERVVISIADNGGGITESVKQHLFDPFFTTKPVGKGTGLGLSISYQIVHEKHGGQLKCISMGSCGAEFVVEIPIRQQ